MPCAANHPKSPPRRELLAWAKGEVGQAGMDLSASSAQGGEWFDDDPPAESRFKHGALEGPLKSLARWMGIDQRTLAKHNGRTGWWIKKIHGRSYAAWFSTERNYAQANQKRLAEATRDSTK